MGNSCSCKISQQVRHSAQTTNKTNCTDDQYNPASLTPRPFVKSEISNYKSHHDQQQSPHTAETESVIEGPDEPNLVKQHNNNNSGAVDVLNRTNETAKQEDSLEAEVEADHPATVCCVENADQLSEKLFVSKGRKRRRSSEDGGKRTIKKRKPTRVSMLQTGVSKRNATALLSSPKLPVNQNSNSSIAGSSLCNSTMLTQQKSITDRRQRPNKWRIRNHCYQHHGQQKPWEYPAGSTIELRSSQRDISRKKKQQIVTLLDKEDSPEYSLTIQKYSNEGKENDSLEISLIKHNSIKYKPISPLVFELPTCIDEDAASVSACNTPSHPNSSRCSGDENVNPATERQQVLLSREGIPGFAIDLSHLPNSSAENVELNDPISGHQDAFRSPPATERPFHCESTLETSKPSHQRPATARPSLQQTRPSGVQEKCSSNTALPATIDSQNPHYSSSSPSTVSPSIPPTIIKFNEARAAIMDDSINTLPMRRTRVMAKCVDRDYCLVDNSTLETRRPTKSLQL